ncbi:PQQ-dependent sugar dehydrogenase [Microbacteriaceae bacterium 4G12]
MARSTPQQHSHSHPHSGSRARRARPTTLAIAATLTLALAGCAAGGSSGTEGTRQGTPAPSPTAAPEAAPTTPSPSSSPGPSPTPEALPGPVQPAGTPRDIATGLEAPWSIVRLASGSTLISERDSARIRELTPDGALRDVGLIEGVVPRGEGGLLGLAAPPGAAADTVAGEDDDPADAGWLYVYFTAETDNRIVRVRLDGTPGSYSLGAREEVLSQIPKAGNHNGGRIAFGPDGKLYATAGDAARGGNAQDAASLGGKILRLEPDGRVPADNPTPNSPVYSLGHRNPQGIAWDETGRMWAAEFGQNTWDELNLIQPGGNYGWPEVEGTGGGAGFVDPVMQWATRDASPSGLAVVRGTLFLAGLGGERLWVIQPTAEGGAGDVVEYFRDEYGRIRDVTAGPDGSLWMITNNTDGRGSPREGDDRLIQVDLVPLAGG